MTGPQKPGSIVNLSGARKSRARAAKQQLADANAAKHGRTKAKRLSDAAAKRRTSATLDAHKREPD